MSNYETDIVIVGAGPVGLFAVFQAGMLKMNCHVFDNLAFIGGQCSALYPEKPIYDIPAYPMISGQDLIDNLEKQASPFKPHYHLNQQIISFKEKDGCFILTSSTGTIIKCKALILAAGCGAFGPNRPPLENIQEYENKSLFYSVRRQDDLLGKKIAIAGGGDSAIDWAINLAEKAEKIYLIHRRANFRCAPASEEKIKELAEKKLIEVIVPYQLHQLRGQNGQLEQVIVKDLENNLLHLEVDILLAFFGLAMDLGPITDWGLDFNKKHLQVDPANFQTNIKNIYAIGDIATYPGKLKLILSGFSEAATACHDIYHLVYPDKPLNFQHSTTKGVI